MYVQFRGPLGLWKAHMGGGGGVGGFVSCEMDSVEKSLSENHPQQDARKNQELHHFCQRGYVFTFTSRSVSQKLRLNLSPRLGVIEQGKQQQ